MAPGPMVRYPSCAVQKFSASAFIQCADAKGPDAPQFTLTLAGEDQTVGPLRLLSHVLSNSECKYCPLADKIQRAYGQANFRKVLCDLDPGDAGICCLRGCINNFKAPASAPQEHSIEAFCNGKVDDLMNAPLLPANCVSNRDTSYDEISDANGDEAPPDGFDSETSQTTYLYDESSPTPSIEDSNSNNPPSAIASAAPTLSSTSSNTAAAGTTSPASTPQETTSEAFSLRRYSSYIAWVVGLGLAFLPAALAF
ncbi:MAG: hypothetical protein Q9214_001041 [Letrouitia sp. 1 TL-2023]